MGLFLFRFWPALLPLLCYLLWFWVVCRRAVAQGNTPPRFRDGPVYWMILATLLIAAICLAAFATSQDAQRGEYIPPHLEDGKMIPGQVKPAGEGS